MAQYTTDIVFYSPAIPYFILTHPYEVPAGTHCALTDVDLGESYEGYYIIDGNTDVWQLIVPVFDMGPPFEVEEDGTVLSGADLVSIYFFVWAFQERDIPRLVDKVNEERAKAIRFKVLSASGSPDWSN